MVQKVNQQFIFSILLADVIKEYEDILREVQNKTENLKSKTFKTRHGRLIMESKRQNVELKNQNL